MTYCLRCGCKPWELCVLGPNHEIVMCDYCVEVDPCLNVH